jgi:hypothetical protein
MDRERAKELLPIIQAFAEGQTIEWRYKNTTQWYVAQGPTWAHEGVEYRIKPEPPKPREWWINEYASRMDAYDSREWADHYSTRGRIRCIHVREVLDDDIEGED